MTMCVFVGKCPFTILGVIFGVSTTVGSVFYYRYGCDVELHTLGQVTFESRYQVRLQIHSRGCWAGV